MEKLQVQDQSVPTPVGEVLWFGDADSLFGVDELGQVFKFERVGKVEKRRLARKLADWFGGARVPR